MSLNKGVSVLIALTVALCINSCSSSGATDQPASAVVNVSGGAVSTPGGTVIEVPDGALAAAATIGIAPVDLNPAGVTRLSNAYRFTPSGQTFSKPVTVKIKITESIKGTPLLFWSKEGDESKFETVTGVLSNGVYTAEVNHFSVGFVGEDAASPGVGGIFPNSGSNNGVITISEIRGTNFQLNAVVKLTRQGEADIAGQDVVIADGTLITCKFDLNAKTPGLWNVVVINPDGTTGLIPYGFGIHPPRPEILSVAPASGLNSGILENVRIHGEYFRAGISVKLNKAGLPDIVATNVTVESSREITCSLDLTGVEAGAWNILVQNNDTEYDVLVGGFTVINQPPVISSIQPNSGINNETVDFVISGSRLRPGAVARLQTADGVRIDAESVFVNEERTALSGRFNLLNQQDGIYDVWVQNPGSQPEVLTNGFAVTAAPITIDSVSPDRGRLNSLVTITIYGKNFLFNTVRSISLARNAIRFYGNMGAPLSDRISATFWLPPDYPIGQYNVEISTANGWGAFLQGGFTIINPAPTVNSISPAAAGNTGVVSITNLAGANFYNIESVKLKRTGEEDISATNLNVVSPTKITCSFDLTGKAPGDWDVEVWNSDGAPFVSTLAGGFSVLQSVSVLSISPDNVKNNPSPVYVTITGTRFIQGASVKLVKSGQEDITASDVWTENESTITAFLNLEGAEVGAWDVVVSEPGSGNGVLKGGFLVTEAAQWRSLGDIGFVDMSSAHPFTVYGGVPYIGYFDVSQSNVAVIKRYNGGVWEKMGDTGVSLPFCNYWVCPSFSIAMHSGVPYIAAVDANDGNKVKVLRFSGPSWEIVGDTGYSTHEVDGVSSNALVFVKDRPNLAFKDNGQVLILEYDGNDWNQMFTGKYRGDISISLAAYGDDLYLAKENYELVKCRNGICVIWDAPYTSPPSLYADETGVYQGANGSVGDGTVAHRRQDGTEWEYFQSFPEAKSNLSVTRDNGLTYIFYRGLGRSPNSFIAVTDSPENSWTPIGGKAIRGLETAGPSNIKGYNGVIYIAAINDLNGLTVYNYSLLYEPPVTGGIAPAQGDSAAKALSAAVTGTGFRPGASVRLLRAGNNDIWGMNVVVESPTRITCDFDLTGKAAGTWDVIVTNADAKSGKLAGGFTITEPPLSWHQVGAAGFSGGAANFVSMKVNGGTPYVAFKDSANGDKASVMKFNGSTWEYVGGAGFSSGTVNYVSLSIDQDVLYVAYQDGNQSGKATVMKFDGTTWGSVSAPGISDGYATYTSLFVSGGVPYLAYTDATKQSRAVVKKYGNLMWTQVGNPVPAVGDAVYVSLYVNGGVPHLAFNNLGNDHGKVSLYKYVEATGWEAVGPTGFSNWSALFISLAFDGGTPYVSFVDSDSVAQTSHPPRVKKYDGSNWVDAGTMAPLPDPVKYSAISFSGGVAYTAFLDQTGGKAVVMKLNGGSWGPLGNTAASVKDTMGDDYALSLFVSDGVPYFAYVDAANGNALSVMKYSP